MNEGLIMKQKNMRISYYFSLLFLFILTNVVVFFPTASHAQEHEQHVLVVYKNSQGKEDVLQNSQHVEQSFKNVPAVSVTLTQEEINNLEANPNISYIEPNIGLRGYDTHLHPVKVDSLSSGISPEEAQWDLIAANAKLAWKEGITGKGVKVAILDTGITSHPDLRISGGISKVQYTTSFADDNGHGTHIAGIVGALRNNVGMVGVAPDIQLYAVKVLDHSGQGYLSDVLSGIDWAISNSMNIINVSLGTTEDSQLLHDIVNKAHQKGIIVVGASGNSGNNEGTGDNINYPAKYSSVLSVAAVDENLVRAPFSSTGEKIDFTAPGVNILSTHFEGGYAYGSGTSQAAPHVTGLLALLKQEYPTKSNEELVAILKTYTKDLGIPGKDNWYGLGLAQYNALLPKGYIDSPAFGATINNRATISGWFLDRSGVSTIEILIDGKVMGTAQYGLPRPDVNLAFPQYQNNYSGFRFALDTTFLSNGEHLLTVRETGKNGGTTVLNNIKVHVQNLLPIGWIDSPTNGSTLQGNVNVSGWFLDQKGISKIEILVDGQSIGTANYGITRLDVQKVYPQYKNAYSGFHYSLNTNSLSDGAHSLTVKAIAMDSTSTTLTDKKITVSNYPAKGFIDTPSFGSTLNNLATISGWFLDGSGVSKIEILIDGKVMGTAQYGLPRPDVNTAFPQYQNGHSGFRYVLDTTLLSNGEHLLTVRETGENRVTTVLNSMRVHVFNLPPIGWIDGPANGSTLQGNVNVSGWFLNQKGISKVEILVDGQYVGTANYGNTRLDVQKVYPQYKNPYSGFHYSFNTKGLTDGVHTLTVKGTGIDGTVTTLSDKKITVSNFPAKGFIDTPSFGSTLNNHATISGWFLDGSEVSKIEVLIDGKVMGTAQYGLPRPDVNTAFPQYQNNHSGFRYVLDTTLLSNGEHLLTVRETGKNGVTTALNSIKVHVFNLPSIGWIDGPANGSTLQGNVNVSGWFLNQKGTSKIEILVDGQYIGTASYGITRPDVQKVYPQYQNAYSGFQYTLNTKGLTDGIHTLTVRGTSVDGTVTTLKDIKINSVNLPARGYLDAPTSGTTISGQVSVSGWFLDGSGVSKIEVLIDGIILGTAQYGIARPDVNHVFPQYQNSHSGFHYILDANLLTNGEHLLTIRETGTNGSITVLNSIKVLVNSN
jgi:hypothetical protein